MNARVNTFITKKYQPFIKWVGGKRGLLKQLLPLFPTEFKNYYEPFVGGGAVFFELYSLGYLKDKKIYLSDINSELINAYNVVKDNPIDLISNLEIYKEKHSKDFYYETRALDREDEFLKTSELERATRFIYLNKTCFNGLYRVNKKGYFNTPIGSYKNPNIADKDTIFSANEALQNTIITNTTFNEVQIKAKSNDLVYFDPPYYPLTETANFTSYSENNFLDEKQKELFNVFDNLSQNNCYVLHSNSDTEFIKKLYRKYNINIVKANRFINSKSNGRGKINEVLIRNNMNTKNKFEDLIETFQESILTWGYFTNFEKVKINVKKVKVELNILNSLIGEDSIEEEFIKLINEYPKTRHALPLLIAVRKDKLNDTPIITNMDTLIAENKKHIFYDDINESIQKELLIFFRESGLKDIFQNKYIKNLVDYCFGVEVGFDTNARKNRTGTLMENIVSSYLNKFCQENKDFNYIEQATQKRILEIFNYEIAIDKNSRRFDFAIHNKNTNKLYLIEVNYYSGGGSKLKATAGEYQYLNDFVKSQNIEFIWITDGKGWLTALNPLEETFNHNDYVININMLKNDVLNEICK